ncbi:hypothetical protein F2Q69_00013290 [Brassica cretica]|uniref:Uncharacterized protein n=1 Tax=Brassica cretica TaxID=69181 RepID=A0A8S9QYE0_BRACR|nr:hypothetical protein F2Q69_00013290 [Brassica cretica]
MPVARGDHEGGDAGLLWRPRGRRHRSPVVTTRIPCSVARGDRESGESTVALWRTGVCDVSQCRSLIFLSYAAFRARNVRGLKDVSRYCKVFVLTLRLRNILDVFTEIAKDVVGQESDRGRRSPRGLPHNHYGVSCGMTAFSDVTEGKERQKPASRRANK